MYDGTPQPTESIVQIKLQQQPADKSSFISIVSKCISHSP